MPVVPILPVVLDELPKEVVPPGEPLRSVVPGVIDRLLVVVLLPGAFKPLPGVVDKLLVVVLLVVSRELPEKVELLGKLSMLVVPGVVDRLLVVVLLTVSLKVLPGETVLLLMPVVPGGIRLLEVVTPVPSVLPELLVGKLLMPVVPGDVVRLLVVVALIPVVVLGAIPPSGGARVPAVPLVV